MGLETRSRGTFLSVQYLRAVAALMVVLHHARSPAPWLFDPLRHYPGFAWGVDVFFVISGFIMGVAGIGESPRAFLGKRLIRVVPLYWALTLLSLLLTLRRDDISLTGPVVVDLVKSLLLLPHTSAITAGAPWPVLLVGWTLVYEMFFYGLFALGLLVRRPLALTATAIPALVVAGLVLHPAGMVASTYTHPVLLEFLAGHLVAVAWWRGAIGPEPAPGVLLVVGFATLLASPVVGGQLELLLRIASAATIVVGALAVEPRVPLSAAGKLLGDASYSIYLTHLVVAVPLARHLARALELGRTPLQLVVVLVGALVLSTAVGVATYRFVERPLLRALRRRLLPLPERPTRDRPLLPATPPT